MPFAIRYEKNILARVHLVSNWRPDIVFEQRGSRGPT